MTLQSLADRTLNPAPAPRPQLQFVAIDRSIMRGPEHIATACSRTMAQRIARALNVHKTNSRGF